MPVYLEAADGSMHRWTGSIQELEERIHDLERRGYGVRVLVL